jgi:hypothetical protein
VTTPAGAAPRRGSLRERLAPRTPRTFRGARAVQIAARTVHIVAMALVLGGVAYSVPERAMVTAVALTLGSGMVLLGVDLWKSGAYLVQGNGVAVLLKLALLGLGQWFPAARIECYLIATAVASIGSHLPRTWRHWSFLHRRVIE